MVSGKMKRLALGFQKSPSPSQTPSPSPSPLPEIPSPSHSSSKASSKGVGGAMSFSRSFGVYFPRCSSVQVQPRPPDVSDLLRLVEELRERESRLKTEILEQKLLKETVAIVPLLENEIVTKDAEIETFSKRIGSLEDENERLRKEVEELRVRIVEERVESKKKMKEMEVEIDELKKEIEERDEVLISSSSSSSSSSWQMFQQQQLIDASARSNLIKNLKNRGGIKCTESCSNQGEVVITKAVVVVEGGDSEDSKSDEAEPPERPRHSRCNSEETLTETADSVLQSVRSRVPRVPKPPPIPSSSSSSAEISIITENRASSEQSIPPPPLPPLYKAAPPPPPPVPRAKGIKVVPEKVRRVPEVVELYHSLMRRDASIRRDSYSSSSTGVPDAAAPPMTSNAACARDMIGEIENRSAYLLAIKTDVETQGDFIRFLIKEVENAVFTNIEDVVPFVKWLDDELSYLVDERAVLKHFEWPEQKADALREAAFGYCDLKKLESEASSFRDDARQPCSPALKKMQALFEKLEHGIYSLSRMRESATNRYRIFKIPTNWMLESGFVSQIKLASVKLAMKYMRRVSAELETGNGAPEEEELIVQGVRFAFRVHQFAGGFDVETMRAFQELRDKARSCHLQFHKSNSSRNLYAGKCLADL